MGLITQEAQIILFGDFNNMPTFKVQTIHERSIPRNLPILKYTNELTSPFIAKNKSKDGAMLRKRPSLRQIRDN